jgi:predicted Zn-dependent protease with MMP-like domain
MDPISVHEFERIVGDALDGLPAEIAALLDNVVVFVDDEHEEDLLGLYEGVPVTEREDYGGFAMPDRVTLYRLALCDMVADRDELVEEITITVIHELAHHLGIDDDRLHELGWA